MNESMNNYYEAKYIPNHRKSDFKNELIIFSEVSLGKYKDV